MCDYLADLANVIEYRSTLKQRAIRRKKSESNEKITYNVMYPLYTYNNFHTISKI